DVTVEAVITRALDPWLDLQPLARGERRVDPALGHLVARIGRDAEPAASCEAEGPLEQPGACERRRGEDLADLGPRRDEARAVERLAELGGEAPVVDAAEDVERGRGRRDRAGAGERGERAGCRAPRPPYEQAGSERRGAVV